MIIASTDFPWNGLDKLADGKLSEFFKPFLGLCDPNDASDEHERLEMLRDQEDELHCALSSLFGPHAFETVSSVKPVEQRYNLLETGVAVGVFSSVFLLIKGVLRSERDLVVAIAPNRDAARFAEDVLRHGFIRDIAREYESHWPTLETLAAAASCFDSLYCERVVSHEAELPWEYAEPRVDAWRKLGQRPTLWCNGKHVSTDRKPRKRTPVRIAKRQRQESSQ